MELLTTDDDGEIVVYECPDCGSQIETPIQDDEPEDDHGPGTPPDAEPDADEAEFEMFEPDDPS